MKEITIDPDLAVRPLGIRERIAVRCLLLLIAMLCPVKWSNLGFREWLEAVERELK